MPDIKTIVPDKTLFALFNKQLSFNKNDAGINPQAVFGADSFALTQYALGYDFYTRRLQCIYGTGTNFIDVGCGAGNWTIAAAGIFRQATGIDAHASRIQTAINISANINSHQQPQFTTGNIQALPYANGQFDALLCYNVITFIHFSHTAFLKEMRRVAANGATLYLTAHTPGFMYWLLYQAYTNKNRTQLSAAWNVFKHNLKFKWGKAPQPTSYFPVNYLDGLFKQTGWQIINKGTEGSMCAPALFEKTFAGQPLMQEYVLKAV